MTPGIQNLFPVLAFEICFGGQQMLRLLKSISMFSFICPNKKKKKKKKNYFYFKTPKKKKKKKKKKCRGIHFVGIFKKYFS